MSTVETVVAYEFLEQIKSLVVHDSHVVRVPTDRTADVKHELRNVHKESRHEIRDILSLLVVTGIESVDVLAGSTVGRIEIM